MTNDQKRRLWLNLAELAKTPFELVGMTVKCAGTLLKWTAILGVAVALFIASPLAFVGFALAIVFMVFMG